MHKYPIGTTNGHLGDQKTKKEWHLHTLRVQNWGALYTKKPEPITLHSQGKDCSVSTQ